MRQRERCTWLPALLQPWLGSARLVMGAEVAGAQPASARVGSSVLAGGVQPPREQLGWNWEEFRWRPQLGSRLLRRTNQGAGCRGPTGPSKGKLRAGAEDPPLQGAVPN